MRRRPPPLATGLATNSNLWSPFNFSFGRTRHSPVPGRASCRPGITPLYPPLPLPDAAPVALPPFAARTRRVSLASLAVIAVIATIASVASSSPLTRRHALSRPRPYHPA
ncbi:hypothetical protein C8J57DRAFT_1523287 [Mycena rebaudengoi]|nr:hypothetical protein C8J57DRAFT_1523287 [Mycena rebaudengoi]